MVKFVAALFIVLTFPTPVLAQTSPVTPPNPNAAVSPAHAKNASTGTTNQTPQVVETPSTLGVLSQSIASPPLPTAWARQTVPVARCETPPRIDGRLDDPCWRTGTHAAGFYPLGTAAPISPGDQTEVWVCADRTHLYVAFHCKDRQPGKIHASETRRDGDINHDDSVGIDIDSQNSRHGLSTFLVTPRGTQVESIEGGTADNITWAGDWKAAAQRTADGWTAEMAIPFALLHYPRGAKSFGMDFFRQIARDGSYQNWPYLPPAGATGNGELLYIHEFTGITPPFLLPRPIFLPYTLATGGAGNSVREGMDIKYPLSTSLTGVATLFPDFQTIEQDVTSINFSYTEKLLTDRRPFFAEGGQFFPAQDLFYSRRIGAVDQGLKVVGKQGDMTVGLLGTVANGQSGQDDVVLNLNKDIGLMSHVRLDYVNDIQPGQASNQVARLEGVYGWQGGPTRYAFQAFHSPSWQGGQKRDGSDYLNFGTQPLQGHPAVTAEYIDIGPNFISNLGFVPETDKRGETLDLNQSNNFVHGPVRYYGVDLYGDAFQHHSGGFFHNDLGANGSVGNQGGLSVSIGYNQGRRDQLDTDLGVLDRFHDHVVSAGFGWGGRTLYQQGGVSDGFGRQAGQRYNFLTFKQGVFVSRPFSVQINYSLLKLGGSHSTQGIVTGTYRLNDVQTVGARLVNQAGADQGTGLGTDIYFSFGQHVRSGDDIFLLFGDPNSPKTRGKVTLKLVRPF